MRSPRRARWWAAAWSPRSRSESTFQIQPSHEEVRYFGDPPPRRRTSASTARFESRLHRINVRFHSRLVRSIGSPNSRHAPCPAVPMADSPDNSFRLLHREACRSLDKPVRMTVQWRVTAQESGPITFALHALMITARGEPGCLSCQLSTELGDDAGLRYTEEWRKEADLKRQLQSDRFTRLAELMERAVDAPRIEFALPEGTRGMDYAVEVRERNGESR